LDFNWVFKEMQSLGENFFQKRKKFFEKFIIGGGGFSGEKRFF
jgi:hypothetical protein